MSSTGATRTAGTSLDRPISLPLGRRELLAAVVSACLVSYLIRKTSPGLLVQTAAALDWPPLIAATILLVLGLYFWDAICVAWLFTKPQRPLYFRTALAARGTSYLLSALNYELGQGLLAWKVARAQGRSALATVGYLMLLAYHDLGVLLSLGLVGALLSEDTRAGALQLFCGGALLALAGVALVASRLPCAWRDRLAQTRWGAWMGDWTWRQSIQLCLLRGVYYLILMTYAVVGLAICRIPASLAVVCSVVPLVLLVDGLPISVSGLGTRETAMLYLLHPDRPEVVLAFSLVWSTGLVLGRLALGLAHWWIPLAIAKMNECPGRREEAGQC